ncbi:hypothetical protein PH210_05430 [Paenibacillus sp. BSR1-1]|uniref:hypothetical protein n=1 Tax=Paenibacillus sp. BSR1-1 TaxID=3020845 RepID=UPI0025AFA746|nr:hypothetical protein [Paenibacillus sp. BSR1-1]MDN3015650.1 hypothetical protein [Paenibacillus sp. BSR1-1]
MHSIVIHFGKKYEDWHLVEPFFYKLQNHNEVIFYWEEESSSERLYSSLVDRMIEHLDRLRIKDWQLIILLNLNDERNRHLRLTTQLSEIRRQLLSPLKDKGFHPLQTLLHLVDMIKRNSHYAPNEAELKRCWELDHFGCLESDQLAFGMGNAFTKQEINKLDEEWGDTIQLQDIVLDQPDHEFMLALKEKCDRVRSCLKQLIIRKKELLVNLGEVQAHDYWMTSRQLEIVLEDFKNKLKQMMTPPLTQSLTNFSPSKELSSSLKFHVGIQSEIGDIRLIRQEIDQSSQRERMKGYLELAYFLLTICHHPSLIERMDKGSASVIQVTLEEERLEKLLKNYYINLVKVKKQIKDQLLLQNQFHTNRFRDDEFAPYTAAAIEKNRDFNPPLSKHPRITYHFFDQWQDQLYKAETILLDRERELLRKSREALKKLNVVKRKNEFLEEEEWIEINDYKQELVEKMSLVHQQVIDIVPSSSEALSTWKNQVPGAKKKMHFLLELIPSQRQYQTMGALIFFILILPFLPLWAATASQRGWTLNFAIVFVVILAVICLGYILTKRTSHRPIWKFQEQTYEHIEKIYQMQVNSQHQYNHYLKQLFKLFSLRKYHEKVSSIAEEKKEQNLLHRYHLIKLEEFAHMANRLLHILQMNIEQDSVNKDRSVPAIKMEKSVNENPIYSPFQQSGLQEAGRNGIEVYLGSAIEQYQSTYFNEIDQIRIQEDKVYKL